MASKLIFVVLAVALINRLNARTLRTIVNGSPASEGEFPYQVSLQVGGEHVCGGTIVSPLHIVTAAHCVTNLDEPMKVVAGTTSTYAGEAHTPADIVYHESYRFSDGSSPYDIAVITLAHNITFNDVQNKIDLPTAPAPDGIVATATGWGYLNASLPTVTRKLNKIDLQTISGDECLQKFAPRTQIHDNQICTFNGTGSGVCGGDSGGPLAYNGTFIGIVSWGVPCATGYPDVFTSVFHFVPWINYIING